MSNCIDKRHASKYSNFMTKDKYITNSLNMVTLRASLNIEEFTGP